jgi:hypothetical protein
MAFELCGSFVVLGIELFTEAVWDVVMGFQYTAFLHISDQTPQLMCSQLIMSFPHGVFPAILTFMAAWRTRTSHHLVYLSQNRGLSRSVFSVKLGISIGEHPFGDRAFPSFVVSRLRRGAVFHISHRYLKLDCLAKTAQASPH